MFKLLWTMFSLGAPEINQATQAVLFIWKETMINI